MSSVSEETKPFAMPPVTLGEMVRYWPGGVRETAREEVGYVFGVSANTGRSANIRLARGESKYGVRHIDDPRLKENEEMKAEGAWEYTQSRIDSDEMKSKLAMLTERLNALEEQLGGTVAGKKNK